MLADRSSFSVPFAVRASARDGGDLSIFDGSHEVGREQSAGFVRPGGQGTFGENKPPCIRITFVAARFHVAYYVRESCDGEREREGDCERGDERGEREFARKCALTFTAAVSYFADGCILLFLHHIFLWFLSFRLGLLRFHINIRFWNRSLTRL